MTAPHQPAPDRSDVPGPSAGPTQPGGPAESAEPGESEESAPHLAIAADLAAAAAGLDDLDGLPVGEHVARYEAVHATLQDALTAIDRV